MMMSLMVIMMMVMTMMMTMMMAMMMTMMLMMVMLLLMLHVFTALSMPLTKKNAACIAAAYSCAILLLMLCMVAYDDAVHTVH